MGDYVSGCLATFRTYNGNRIEFAKTRAEREMVQKEIDSGGGCIGKSFF